MVHRKYPFDGKSFPELYFKIQNDEPEYKEGLNPDLIDLFKGILEKDPEKRFEFHEIKINKWLTKNGIEPLEEVDFNQSIKLNQKDFDKVIKMIKVNIMRKIKFKVKQK